MTSYDHIAAWADRNEYTSYNMVICLMEADGMLPGYERKTFDIYHGVGLDYGYGELLSTILDDYVAEHGPMEILL